MDEVEQLRLKAALQMVTDAVIGVDAAGRILLLNPAAERLLGCSDAAARGQLLGERCRFYRDDKRRLVEIDPLAATRENELPFSFAQSLQLKIAEREPLPVEMTCSAARDAAAGAMVMVRDLSERRRGADSGAAGEQRALQALRASEERLDRLANAVPSVVWSAAPDGAITWSSARWYEYTGLTWEENSQNWLQVVHPDDRERCAQAWSAALRDGSEYTIEVRNRRYDGVYRWFLTRATPVPDAQGEITGWFGSTTDVHDLKLAEVGRRESQRRLRFALEAATIGEWEIDLASGKARTSLEHDRCFGYSEPLADWSVEKFFAAVHPEDRDEVRSKVRAAREADRLCQFECRVVWPDQSVHWIETHSMIYRGADGKPSHVAGIVRDVTARKRSEEALREAYRHRDEFLANVSHELRSPMASLMGFAELLSVRLKDPDDLEFVRIIKDSGNYLMTLINDLLDLAKMESGKLEIRREPVRLMPLLHDLQALMDSRARDKGLRLSLRLEGAVPETIEADPIRLRQILINLIGNAVKFTERGAVDVTARYDNGSAALILEIADTGLGIAPEAQRRLFEPFTQFATTAALRQGGSGLGLAITRRLVELMGGTITCESEVGKGSCFCVKLPAVVARPLSAAAAAPAQALRIVTRVLAVDDREEFRYLLRHHLEAAGAEVVLACDGRAALDEYHRAQDAARPFVLVILDMQMPVLDGYGTARQLRAEGANVAIVALTASAYDQDVQKCYNAGCDAHLTKPIDPAKLVETVAHWSARRSGSAARPVATALKILLIDDNRITCKSLGMLLEMGGHEVRSAHDGRSALAIVKDFHPDVVVSDIKLPDTDGFDLLRQLRDQGGLEKTKFIALSGYSENAFHRQEPGFHHFLHKPVRVEELEMLLSKN